MPLLDMALEKRRTIMKALITLILVIAPYFGCCIAEVSIAKFILTMKDL